MVSSRHGQWLGPVRAGNSERKSKELPSERRSEKFPPVLITATEVPIANESEKRRNSNTIRAIREVFVALRTRWIVGSTAVRRSISRGTSAGGDGGVSGEA